MIKAIQVENNKMHCLETRMFELIGMIEIAIVTVELIKRSACMPRPYYILNINTYQRKFLLNRYS